MTEERFLVTGALGCIGAWTATLLVREGTTVVAFDPGASRHRLELIATTEEIAAITFVSGDVGDLEQVTAAVREHEITHVVHLAALQVPFCRENPSLGARVNVVGTVNVFEAAKSTGLETTVAYASSAAVYDASGARNPQTLYGVYKIANEGTARIYSDEAGIASVGIRPYTIFGPGRDQGVTAEPTHAMAAVARREPYRIKFGGRTALNYASDVARGFIGTARSKPAGAFTYEFPGESLHMSEIVAAIERAAPDAAGLVSFDDVQLPFPDRLPGEVLDARVTPLDTAVQETIELFRASAS